VRAVLVLSRLLSLFGPVLCIVLSQRVTRCDRAVLCVFLLSLFALRLASFTFLRASSQTDPIHPESPRLPLLTSVQSGVRGSDALSLACVRLVGAWLRSDRVPGRACVGVDVRRSACAPAAATISERFSVFTRAVVPVCSCRCAVLPPALLPPRCWLLGRLCVTCTRSSAIYCSYSSHPVHHSLACISSIHRSALRRRRCAQT
jgi:hypothetical protein